MVYIYFGYPLVIFLMSKIFNKEASKKKYNPTVSILIAAYNEEKSIGETIENKLSLDYPKDKLEIIVVSDGSTDRTDEIVKLYSKNNVKLIRQELRSGKTMALNLAVQEAKGEVIVFSDANSIYEKDALPNLVKNFNDPEVGYITGKMIYTDPDGTIIGDGCSAYMRYENFLRKYESRVGSIVGVDGGIDAIRKSLYEPMRADQLPDFVLPLKVIEKGYRVVYEPEAILREDALKSSKDEYQMRVRVSLRALWALYDMKNLFNPFKYGFFSWQLFSHKALRYMVFMFLFCLYVSNGLLLSDKMLYKFFFLAQNSFYLIACLGLLKAKKGESSKIIRFPYYFTLLNFAAGHAFLHFLKGKKQVVWNPRTG